MRLNLLIKCFQLVQLFYRSDTVSIKMICETIDVSHRTAYRYLDAMSIVFPVYKPEHGRYAFLKGDR